MGINRCEGKRGGNKIEQGEERSKSLSISKGLWNEYYPPGLSPSGQNGPTFIYLPHSVTRGWMLWEECDGTSSLWQRQTLKELIAIGSLPTTLLIAGQQVLFEGGARWYIFIYQNE